MVETGQHEPLEQPPPTPQQQQQSQQEEHSEAKLDMKSEQSQPQESTPHQPSECALTSTMYHNPSGPTANLLVNHLKVSKFKGPKGEKRRRRKKKRPAHKSKMITGYIIYASEIRKDVIKKFPNRDFGYISKLVGIEWKNLPVETKVEYEKRAQEQNAESRAIAATELKKLADAEEKAREEALLLPATTNGYSADTSHHFELNNQNNSFMVNSPQAASQHQNTNHPQLQLHNQQQLPYTIGDGYTQSPNKISMQQQPPLQIIHHHHQQQPVSTTVQYCNNSIINGGSGCHNDNSQLFCNNSFASDATSQSPKTHLQRNTIVYRKPATVRLKPKDAPTQTEPINWISGPPKKPLRFSQTFIDYLSKSFNA